MGHPKITALYRYPVKGLSPERLADVSLTPGEALPLDRVYAIENGPGAFDEAAPRHLPKVAFLCLMRDERLATLRTRLVTSGGLHELQIDRGARRLASGDLRTAEGRASIEAFFVGEMAGSLRGRPRVVAAPGHSFSDVKEKCVHLINLASVRALEHAMGQPIDPLRFRANVHIDGLEAWAELDWAGRDIAIGAARLQGFKRTVRCAATEVDPATGARDANVPDAIAALTGHRDFGIYAMVTGGGAVREGCVFG
jgi:uncharacterized protein